MIAMDENDGKKKKAKSTVAGSEAPKRTKAFHHRLKVRHLTPEDYAAVRDLSARVYPHMGPWPEDRFLSQVARFPEGQICIEDHGKIVGVALSVVVDYARYGDDHTYKEITDGGYIRNHDPEGDTLYGVDVFVDPDYRGLRLGRRLYDARKELCEKLNLRAIMAGGRIPGYDAHADEMTPQQYIQKVKNLEIHDPVLSFQLSNDFHVRRVLRGYLPQDVKSQAFATLLEWINIHYEEKPKLFGAAKSVVRVGAIQWQMRPMQTTEEFFQQVEFFVDAVSSYKADFALFPEFINAPLMARFNQDNPAQAIRELADFTDEIRDRMVKYAVSYNVNIIAGTMPEYRDGALYNVAYLCRRDGTWDTQYKLHVTPDEQQYWGLRGGTELKVFETDVGKIGVLICFDVEFPELPRLLAEQGMSLLFVPYWTDTRNAYLRVRHCAQARAIENECYVVIAGAVGNLPKVENMDIQYSQAAIFTPSDYAFPHDAIAAEATPNTEMTLIADLDREKLKELRSMGSVRNFQQRRLDLYSLKWGKP